MHFLAIFKMQAGEDGAEIRSEIRNGIFVGIVIVDAKAAAYIEEAEIYSFKPEFCLKVVDSLAEYLERFAYGDLRTDMEMKPSKIKLL